MKKVAILQSNYIPWKGYFDLINSVDEFIIYDDAQYTKRDWRNRNRIKTSNGCQWLTIPTEVSGKFYQPIKETRIADPNWGKLHWKSISMNYSKAKHFRDFSGVFEPLFLGESPELLSKINFQFIKAICEILNITTSLKWSMDYPLKEQDPTLKLLELCKASGASSYLSGPAAKAYLDSALFKKEGIDVGFCDYSNYKEYSQLYPPFEHAVTVLDLIFNEGPLARNYLKSGSSKNALEANNV